MSISRALIRTTILCITLQCAIATLDTTTRQDCSCGFYDPETSERFTDSIVVYFNETGSLPNDFTVQNYENHYEKGWNTQYRQGAIAGNVGVGKTSMYADNGTTQALELYCDSTNPTHLVNGGGIQTSRQDIFFGSFRASLRGTPDWVGGSALSMTAFFNETQTWQIDNTNPNPPDKAAGQTSQAWVAMLIHSQFPDRKFGVNYTQLEDPWNFTEYRVDWWRDEIRYYVGGNLYRKVTRDHDPLIPQTPAPITIKHWSTGNFFSTQGPPAGRSIAQVEYVRMFFNSSLSTLEDQKAFDSRCKLVDACLVDNINLRNSTTIPTAAAKPWKQAVIGTGDRTIPRVIAYTCISATALVLLFAFMRRAPWETFTIKLSQSLRRKTNGTPWPQDGEHTAPGSEYDLFDSKNPRSWDTPFESPMDTPRPGSMIGIPYDVTNGGANFQSQYGSRIQSSDAKGKQIIMSLHSVPGIPTEADPDRITPIPRSAYSSGTTYRTTESSSHVESKSVSVSVNSIPGSASEEEFGKKTDQKGSIHVTATQNQAADSSAPKAKVRIDYLAGLVAMASLLVTAIHFCLTFAGAAINPDAYTHNQSEVWARKTVSSYFLNLNWIGPFLMTSTRFLISTYLRTGNLKNLAEKTLGRPFRLIIPIAVIAILEYFFMDSGATNWLEYMASVTWSTWPFTTVPDNFGTFLSEILALAYLIPNAAPQITFNYCTGVLWTIPVQLQGSWTTIMGVIMIRQIKTSWKRFAFYAWCCTIHWYAQSWGTFFYLAILLTDMDLTYDWKKWLATRPFVRYPLVIFSAAAAFFSLSLDMMTQYTLVNYAQIENGWHPDAGSGLFIRQTANFAYPQYFVPKLNGLTFSFALQVFVELSPLAQQFYSLKFFTWIFPHIFTIYLIHGFVFWSLGSMLCVYFASHDLPYSINITLVAIACYSAIALSVPILTPVLETLGKGVTGTIWRHASEEPAPLRPTLYPFPLDLLEKSGDGENVVVKDGEDVEKGAN